MPRLAPNIPAPTTAPKCTRRAPMHSTLPRTLHMSTHMTTHMISSVTSFMKASSTRESGWNHGEFRPLTLFAQSAARLKYATLAVLVAFMTMAGAHAAEPDRKPNVLVIVADDLGYAD